MKLNKTTKILLKLLIITASYAYIAIRLYNNRNYFNELHFDSLIIPLLIIILMPVNWLIESVKWKYLVRKFSNISLWTSLKGVFTGLTAAVFTPNRIGEYFGRIVVLDDKYRIKGIFATIVGSFAQILTTVFFGIISLYLLVENKSATDSLIQYNNTWTWIFLSIMMIITVLLYFNISWFEWIFRYIPFVKKYRKHFVILKDYSKKDLFVTLFYSVLRYVVFVSQYILFLYFFDVRVGIYESIICIGAGYLVILAVPTFTIAEIGVRGSVALFFLEMFSQNTTGIISATVSLWIVNLAIPAFLGSIILYRQKL